MDVSGLTSMIIGKRAFARIAFPLYVVLVLAGHWSAVSRSSTFRCSWNIRPPKFVLDTVCRLRAYNYDVLFVPVNSCRKWRSCNFQHSVVTLGRQYDQFQPS